MDDKKNFMKSLYSVLPNNFYDPEAVNECIDTVYEVFDMISCMLNPADQDAIEEAVAQIICFCLPYHNADGIADRIKKQVEKWGDL